MACIEQDVQLLDQHRHDISHADEHAHHTIVHKIDRRLHDTSNICICRNNPQDSGRVYARMGGELRSGYLVTPVAST